MLDGAVYQRREKWMADSKLGLTVILLVLVLFLSVALTYYPHISYQFPLHVDEWYHIATAQSIAKTGPLTHLSIYTGQLSPVDIEIGYHTLLALVLILFEPSITAWTYIPLILQVIAVLVVFLFVYRLLGRNEALISALLIALLPTNVTIGGPAFLIPENLGLIFIPLALLFAFRLTTLKPLYNYIGLFLVTVFLLYSHPPTALVLLIILFIYALFLLLSKVKSDRKLSKYLIAVIFASVIVALPNYVPYLGQRGLGGISFGLPVTVGPVFLVYGILQSLFFVVGIYVLIKASGRSKFSKEVWSLLATAVVLFGIIILFIWFKVNYLLPYQRVFMPLFLIMSIFAASGYLSLLRLNRAKGLRLGSILLAVALIATIYLSIHEDVTTPYYHLITQQDYLNFLWIRANYPSSSIAIMNPYTARAFTPITGMRVYAVEPFGPSAAYTPLLSNESAFFAQNCSDTSFLRANNISIVYTDNATCVNSNLTLVHNGTYVLNYER
ncbi:MAG: glycosyltransferase family 39 protein [Thaumarchaeota archaeon]|nr:glycosyltransferase family 39 protein [Nitrososphaerota archaeon]